MKLTLIPLLAAALLALPLVGNADDISGKEVTKITYAFGVIEKIGPDTWIEKGDNGTVFSFKEIGAFPIAVTLFDETREVTLTLSMVDDKVFFSDTEGNHFPRFAITGKQTGTWSLMPEVQLAAK